MNYKVIVADKYKNDQQIIPDPLDFKEYKRCSDSKGIIQGHLINFDFYCQGILLKVSGIQDLSDAIDSIQLDFSSVTYLKWDSTIISFLSKDKGYLLIPFTFDYQFIKNPYYSNINLIISWKKLKYINWTTIYIKKFNVLVDLKERRNNDYYKNFFIRNYISKPQIEFKNNMISIELPTRDVYYFDTIYINSPEKLTIKKITGYFDCVETKIPHSIVLNNEIIKKENYFEHSTHKNLDSKYNLYNHLLRSDTFITIEFEKQSNSPIFIDIILSYLVRYCIHWGQTGKDGWKSCKYEKKIITL